MLLCLFISWKWHSHTYKITSEDERRICLQEQENGTYPPNRRRASSFTSLTTATSGNKYIYTLFNIFIYYIIYTYITQYNYTCII